MPACALCPTGDRSPPAFQSASETRIMCVPVPGVGREAELQKSERLCGGSRQCDEKVGS